VGLRINSNTAALSALRNLRLADGAQNRSLNRLSTGLRINTAADDPSGLVISEQFRAQIASLKQAVDNTEFASNLIGTAESALSETSNLLIGIRESLIFALNTGGTSAEQIDAEQDSVDSAISAIDRIAGTTRYGRTSLLNGSQSFATSTVAAGITDLNLRSVFFGVGSSSLTFTAEISSVASHAGLTIGTFGTSSGTIRISGALGTEDITLSVGDSVSGAINAVREFTGVFASGGVAYSEGYGTSERVDISVVTGTGYTGTTGTDFGTNLGVSISGSPLAVNGLNVKADGTFIKAELTFASTVSAGDSLSFTVLKSGLNFQLNSEAIGYDSIRIGIQSTDSVVLGKAETVRGASGGTIGGFLSSLTSGGANDLRANPGNALAIVDAALDQINGLRGFLGAIEQHNLQPNARSLNIAIENLTSSESKIRDLDFAAEVSEFTRTQVLFAAGTSVLASANLIPQTVLTLLR